MYVFRLDHPTQPRMYQTIKKHPTVVEQYSQKLIKEGVVSETDYQAEKKKYDVICLRAHEKSKDVEHMNRQWLDSSWGRGLP